MLQMLGTSSHCSCRNWSTVHLVKQSRTKLQQYLDGDQGKKNPHPLLKIGQCGFECDAVARGVSGG